MKKITIFDEQGVSETVGFIIIFGIVMTGIGMVTLLGYPALLQQQQEANIRNMEKTLIVLQTDLNSIAFKNVPYQETTVQVSGGTLSILKDLPDRPYFSLQIPGVGERVFRTGKLKYISDDGTTISLENGAVVKRYNGIEGSVMISKPRWFYDSTTHTVVIPMITINGSQDFSQTGIGTVSMKLTDIHEFSYNIADETQTSISYYNYIEDDYYRAWEQYLSSPELPLIVEDQNRPFSMRYNFGRDPISMPVEKLVIKNYNITFISL
ncbi:MAG TPA: hypothetical protein PK445_09775 [Methanolinea sp.]|nr:hypothetical protein [Methanolinea sp.]